MCLIRRDVKLRRAFQSESPEVAQRDQVKSQADLAQKITAHFKRYTELAPAIENFQIESSAAKELQKLYLPSSFVDDERTRLELVPLAKLEMKLRIGHAHESLEKLRGALGLRSGLARTQKASVRGQTAVTRAASYLRRADRLIQEAKESYVASYHAASRLGCTFKGTDGSALRMLSDDDLVPLSSYTEHSRWKTSGVPVSWIWRIAEDGPDQDVKDNEDETWINEGEKDSCVVPALYQRSWLS